MSKRSTALVLLAAMAVAGCGGVKVNSDWNRSIDFSGFQTFGLMPPGETDGSGEASDSITDQRIKAAITADLEGKGLRKVDDNADIMVGYQITTKEDTSYQIVGTAWDGGGWGWGGRWGWGRGMAVTSSSTRAVHATVGTLVITVFDSSSKYAIWHGDGTNEISKGGTPDERTQRINEAVAKIFEQFPPPASPSF